MTESGAADPAVPVPARLRGLCGRLILVAALTGLGGCLTPPADPDPAPMPAPESLPQGWSASLIAEPEFGSRMYLVEAGPVGAPPVVLIHGLGRTASDDWHPVMERLSTSYRVIAPDLPGFGRSDRLEGPLSPQRYTAMLHWLFRERGLRDVHLVGHSMGGAVALFYASEHPENVRDLVVADVAGILHRTAFVRTVINPSYDLSLLPDGFEKTLRRLADAGERFLERIVGGPDVTEYLRENDPEWRGLLSERPSTNAALGLIRTNYAGRLEQLGKPVTLIWGSEDTVAPRRIAHLLDGRLPRSRLHFITGAAHAPITTHPNRFVDLMREAWAEPPGSAAPRQPSPVPPDAPEYQCIDRIGERISGVYERVVLQSCVDMKLVDVRTNHIHVEESLVEMTNVQVAGPPNAPAVEVRRSAVQATNLFVSGAPALRVGGSRMDLAGAELVAPGSAVNVLKGSGFVFSVSEMRSGLYQGYLHGAGEVSRQSLDIEERFRPVVDKRTLRPPAGD